MAGGIGLLIGSVIAGAVAKKLTSKQLIVGGILLVGLGIMIYSRVKYPRHSCGGA
jgi:hypothetical protein